ncbi:TlpA family protein disulfide reductase [Spirosoma gilvum]
MNVSRRRVIIGILAVWILTSLNCQAQKYRVYIDGETERRYTQLQFDSLSRILVKDPDKVISLTKSKEVTNEIQTTFNVMVITSVASVKRNWLDKRLPTFSFQDTTGRIYDNASIAGKVAVLNLWSTTCIPCLEEIPQLNALVNRYAGQGVVFLALAPESLTQRDKVLSKQNFMYTILPQAQSLFNTLDAVGYPYHIVVDRAGYLRYIQSGTTNSKTSEKIAEAELPNAIEQALK